MHVFIVGCGYIGSALADGARALWGVGATISALRRRAGALPAGVRLVPVDLSSAAAWPPLANTAIDAVVFCAAPAEQSPPTYEAISVRGTERVLIALGAEGHRPKQVIFVSSTGVYAQDDGALVDEQAATTPSRYQGQIMLRAEAAAQASGWPTSVLRFGGIYGPQRDGLIRRIRAQTASQPQGRRYTNRIHRDDCVGAILHLLQRGTNAPVYNGVDDLSADQGDVLQFLASRLQVPLPPRGPAHGHVTGKRVSNAFLRAHGYVCRYPTYQEGYDAILRAEHAK